MKNIKTKYTSLIYKAVASVIIIFFGSSVAWSQHQCEYCIQEGITNPDSIIQIETVLPFDNKVSKVTLEVKDGLAYFEGDIILGHIDDLLSLEKGLAINGGVMDPAINNNLYWPNGIIPYVINSGFSSGQLDDINDAISNVQSATNLTFVSRTTQVNYMTISSQTTGCGAGVGMTNTPNNKITEVGLSSGCSLGNIMHELLHVAGMSHEQNRGDRDTYVNINFSNIQSDRVHNFQQKAVNYSDHGDYDYGSIMHYSAFAFAINNSIPTITTIPSGIPIGQRDALSAGDIATINAIYPDCWTSPQIISGSLINADIRNGRFMSNNEIDLSEESITIFTYPAPESDDGQFIQISAGTKITCKEGTRLVSGSKVKLDLDGCH